MHPIFSKAIPFLEGVFHNLPESIEKETLQYIDHICYRVETSARYDDLKNDLSQAHTLEDESIINGRPISIFRLNQPLHYHEYRIEALELPSPSSTPYKEGFEHLEFVIPNLLDLLQTHHDLQFDTKGLTRKQNKDISLRLRNGSAVKFHEQHIFEVLRLENQKKK